MKSPMDTENSSSESEDSLPEEEPHPHSHGDQNRAGHASVVGHSHGHSCHSAPGMESHEIHLDHPDKSVIQPHKESLVKRLNRVLGQVNGIHRMVQEDRYCVDILTQISAVKAALDGVAMQLLEDHTRHCVKNAIHSGGGDEAIGELIEIIRKYTR